MAQKTYKERTLELSLKYAQIKKSIRKRDNYRCYFCRLDLHVVGLGNSIHHVIPKSWGGSLSKNNCITICKKCHEKIELLNNKMLKYLIKEDVLIKQGHQHGLALTDAEINKIVRKNQNGNV